MGYRHERLVGVFDEGRFALDLSDAVDEPVPLHLQHARDISQPVDAGAHEPAAQDVLDEGTVHPRHLGDMAGTQAELLGAGETGKNRRFGSAAFDFMLPLKFL